MEHLNLNEMYAFEVEGLWDSIDYIFQKYNQLYPSSFCVHTPKYVRETIVDTVNHVYFKFNLQRNRKKIEIHMYKLSPELETFVRKWIETKANLLPHNTAGKIRHSQLLAAKFITLQHEEPAIDVNTFDEVINEITKPLKEASLNRLFHLVQAMLNKHLDEQIHLIFK